jgi:pyrroline-5-carboxylate reductase
LFGDPSKIKDQVQVLFLINEEEIMKKTIGVIGYGSMGKAIVRGLLKAKVLQENEIIVSRTSDAQNLESSSNKQVVAQASLVLLAVKPKDAIEVLEEIRDSLDENSLLVSVVAGLTCAKIDRVIDANARIVRVMPNTPVRVGEGMTVIAKGPRATEDDITKLSKLFHATGEVEIIEEEQMDAATAIAGSGPAYLFYLMESMIEAGEQEGLSHSLALKLASQTLYGAAKLLKEEKKEANDLRREVTSPGGTTQAATDAMDSKQIKRKLSESIRAAATRSRELS